MSSFADFTYSDKKFVSTDSKVPGEFQIFGTLSGHMKRVIMEGMSPVALINLVEADPSLADLAKSVMKRTSLLSLSLNNLDEEWALEVVIDWEHDNEAVKFKNDSRCRAGEIEMYRKAYTFILKICEATNVSNALLMLHSDCEIYHVHPLPKDLHLLGLPSLDRVLSVRGLTLPANAPIDFVTQVNTSFVSYNFPFKPYRRETDEELEFARLVELDACSPRI